MSRLPDPNVRDFAGIRRNFDALLSLINKLLDGRKIRRGTGTATIINGTQVNSAPIPHGLGAVPVSVVATARETADTRDDYVVDTVSRDATNVVYSVRGAAAEQFPISNPTVVTFDWIAMT